MSAQQKPLWPIGVAVSVVTDLVHKIRERVGDVEGEGAEWLGDDPC